MEKAKKKLEEEFKKFKERKEAKYRRKERWAHRLYMKYIEKEFKPSVKFQMTDESVKTKDELSLTLYDKDGKIKQTSKKRISKLEKFIRALQKVLEKW